MLASLAGSFVGIVLCLLKTVSADAVSNCQPSTFEPPDIDGVQYLAIHANAELAFTAMSLPPATLDGASYTIDFCNVTVTYTHPGWNDTINVSVWLPLSNSSSNSSWNGRLWAVGGSGFAAGVGSLYMTQAVAKGFAALMTDSGHPAGLTNALRLDWALSSPGNLNLPLLYDFGLRTLGEMGPIGKKTTKDFFARTPDFAYFSGCSQGGRQGLEIAQRFPTHYDGILAAAPAIYFDTFLPAASWARQVMDDMDVYPSPCEIDVYIKEAVNACDGLDGVRDGIISHPDLCSFNPHSVMGKQVACNGTSITLSVAGAEVVAAAWRGPSSPSGDISWPGLNKDTSLTANYVATSCAQQSRGCSLAASPLLDDFFKYLLNKDPAHTTANMTDEQFLAHLRTSHRELGPIFGSADPNLSEFKATGGKMISWHGLADETIPPAGTIDYYKEVLAIDPDASDFFRFFEAPGVGHCACGPGPFP
ncbi:hypothetical protein M409DRAFT_51201 [Zasmidium cellare ATCC 36951]|uniref:Carboxylic ester hydrolase n=1 Tax=Zasmidium cellare ATCC 36951 TaxID=1080233 RepID=A0A6A6CV20_ZASCE|nr:uncharacterized protein M409DRAFT_51201 [Zasmidium cellare ATCC 36951]KAF2170961.1 hypothetical protein M409DRAFT_51201 [Zasmidium cellare ATCC 36951]